MRKEIFEVRLFKHVERQKSKHIGESNIRLETRSGNTVDYDPQVVNKQTLLARLRNVMHLERAPESSASRVGFEYYRLGKEYLEYISVARAVRSHVRQYKSADQVRKHHRRRRPPWSCSALIRQAILSSSEGRMSLWEICSWISETHPDVYSMESDGEWRWQNTDRHDLS